MQDLTYSMLRRIRCIRVRIEIVHTGQEETWRMTRKEEARKSQRALSYICMDWSSIFVFIPPEIICKACVWETLIQMGKSFSTCRLKW